MVNFDGVTFGYRRSTKNGSHAYTKILHGTITKLLNLNPSVRVSFISIQSQRMFTFESYGCLVHEE